MISVEDMELGFVYMSAVLGLCGHLDAVPVETLTGEFVAWLCPGCDQQLPAGWARVSGTVDLGQGEQQ